MRVPLLYFFASPSSPCFHGEKGGLRSGGADGHRDAGERPSHRRAGKGDPQATGRVGAAAHARSHRKPSSGQRCPLSGTAPARSRCLFPACPISFKRGRCRVPRTVPSIHGHTVGFVFSHSRVHHLTCSYRVYLGHRSVFFFLKMACSQRSIRGENNTFRGKAGFHYLVMRFEVQHI